MKVEQVKKQQEAEVAKKEDIKEEEVKVEQHHVVSEEKKQEEEIATTVASETMSQTKVAMNGDVSKTSAPAKQVPAAVQQNGHAVNGVTSAANGAGNLAPKFIGTLEETVRTFTYTSLI